MRKTATGILGVLALSSPALAAPAQDGPALSLPSPSVSLMGTGLHTADLERALRFWRDGMGMVEVNRQQFGSLTEVIMAFGGDARGPLVFLLYRADADPAPQPDGGHDKTVLRVSDIDALMARLERAGFATAPIRSMPQFGVRQAWLSDPDGHNIEVFERHEAAAAKGAGQ